MLKWSGFLVVWDRQYSLEYSENVKVNLLEMLEQLGFRGVGGVVVSGMTQKFLRQFQWALHYDGGHLMLSCHYE